jgi:DNA-binding CsgD family transcriptional regulator
MPNNRRITSLAPTQKELAILLLVSKGLSNIDIAEKMQVSQRTVASHVQNLLNKTGCRSRFTLILHFIDDGLIPPIGTNSEIKRLELQVSELQRERVEMIAQLQKIRDMYNQSIAEILNQLDPPKR